MNWDRSGTEDYPLEVGAASFSESFSTPEKQACREEERHC